jgi:TonB-linked SusC/RagA family outer membrane protein
MTSINGGSPLVLIDGVEGDINLINPEDVASVSVLKDAAAAAIYGARASFGVILVTTKHGQKGQLKIQYSNDIGWNTPTYLPHVITNSLAAAELQNEGYKGYAGIDNSTMIPIINYLEKRQSDPSLPEVGVDASNNTWLFGGNFDWYKAFFSRHQSYQKHFLSLSGGSDKVTYYLSGGIQDQDGVFKVATDTYKRYNFRSKLSLQAFSWLQIYNNTEFDQDIYDAPNKYVNGDYNIYRYLSLFASPYFVPKTPDGNWTQAGMLTYGSQLDGGREVTRNQIFRNTIGFKADFFNGKLTLNGDFTAMWTQQKDDRKARTLEYESKPGTLVKYSNPDFFQSSFLQDFYKVVNLYAQYTNDFGKHHLDALVGVNRELNQQRSFTSYISDNLSDDYASLNLASGVAHVSDDNADWALQGVFSRVSYNYDERYLVEFNGRYDGTSRFPARDRYGFFPSVSAGWMISREKFFEPVTHIINTLKIRTSYGSLGNQQVGTYAYVPIMSFSPITQILDGAHPVGTNAPGLVARSLTWETARTFDVGADVGFLNGRLQLGLDWYRRNTVNMLTKSKQLPAVLGTGEPKTNAADLKTLGWETSLKWRDQFQVADKPFSYDLQFVISDNRSEITRYDNPNGYLGDYYVGENIGEIWGYVTDGFFKTDDEYATSADQSKVSSVAYSVDGHPVAGDIKFRDLNGDGTIYNGDNTLSNHGDMKVIGNSTPRYSYGFNAHAAWNKIDLSVFFQGVGKRDFWPGVESGIFWGFYNRWNQPVYDHIYGNYWTPEHTDAYFPKPRAYIASHAGSALYYAQTRYLQNAAYLRLKNLSIGYTITAPMLARLHVTGLRVFLSGQNLFTWTRLSKAFDPETIVDDTDVPTSNGNGFVYPIQKTYSGGLSITF